jgi:hypothetical protein
LVGGRVLQRIPRDKWFSLNKKGKKRLPPAPFDQPFHLFFDLSVNSIPGIQSNGKMKVDFVKVYQKPAKSSTFKRKDFSDSSDSSDSDEEQFFESPRDGY